MGDVGLSILVAILVLIEFVLAPLEGFGTLNGQAINLLIGLLIGIGALMVVRPRIVQLCVIVLMAASAAANLHGGAHGIALFRIFESALHFAIYGILIVGVSGAVFAPGEINLHRVLGSIAIYFLVALVFADAYNLIRFLDPQSFVFRTKWNALYFSFTTLTTAGYGDIAPAGPIARSLANLQAVFGQLYPATIIARLITLHIGQKD